MTEIKWTMRDRLIEMCGSFPVWHKPLNEQWFPQAVERLADHLIAHGVTVQQSARPLEEWGEDYGDVLWWKFPIEEPPYVGSPLDANWPAYHTHWTPIVLPEPPKTGGAYDGTK